MHSTKRRHQSPEGTIRSHVDCVIQGEVIGPNPHRTRVYCWSPPVLQGEGVKIFLAFASSGNHTVWANREKYHAWTIAERCGCLVVCFISSIMLVDINTGIDCYFTAKRSEFVASYPSHYHQAMCAWLGIMRTSEKLKENHTFCEENHFVSVM